MRRPRPEQCFQAIETGRIRAGGHHLHPAVRQIAGEPGEPQAARMSVSQAFVEGLMRVKRAPWLVIGVWLSTVLVALPFAVMLQAQIGEHLGASLAAQAAAEGVNYDWWNEFLAQTSGIGVSFVPAIIGFAAVMKNLSTIADTSQLPLVVGVAISIHTVLSLFLAGGILDRLARDRATGAAAFFSACGVFAVVFYVLGI